MFNKLRDRFQDKTVENLCNHLVNLGIDAELYKGVNEQMERLIANNYVDTTERTDKWWFKLHEVDGRLIISTAKNEHKLCREYPLA